MAGEYLSAQCDLWSVNVFFLLPSSLKPHPEEREGNNIDMGQLERRGHPTQRLASSSPSNLYATSHFQKPPFAATDGCVSNCINCITQNCTFFTRVAEDVNRLSLCLWCSSLHLVTCHHPSASSLSSSVAQNTLFIWNKMSTRRSPLSGACVWMLSKRCYFWKSAWSILESPAIQGEGGQAWAGMLIKSWVFRISCCCFFSLTCFIFPPTLLSSPSLHL